MHAWRARKSAHVSSPAHLPAQGLAQRGTACLLGRRTWTRGCRSSAAAAGTARLVLQALAGALAPRALAAGGRAKVPPPLTLPLSPVLLPPPLASWKLLQCVERGKRVLGMLGAVQLPRPGVHAGQGGVHLLSAPPLPLPTHSAHEARCRWVWLAWPRDVAGGGRTEPAVQYRATPSKNKETL